jgi:hypothetical protein
MCRGVDDYGNDKSLGRTRTNTQQSVGDGRIQSKMVKDWWDGLPGPNKLDQYDRQSITTRVGRLAES